MPLEIDGEPFMYRPLPKSSQAYTMVDGVVRVWADKQSMMSGAQDLYPIPGTAADFFTDMHRVLRYASLGPVKSFCHHRWVLRCICGLGFAHRAKIQCLRFGI